MTMLGTPPADLVDATGVQRPTKLKRRLPSSGGWTAGALLVVVAVVTGVLRPATVSNMGASLLLGPALPLVFASLAQMVIILVGDFDLGIGYAVGLVNVFTATALTTNVGLGAALMIAMVLAYVAMGAIVELFHVPAIVVTLGASFIWLGVGLTVQPTPGGTAAGWLETATNGTWPVIPEPVYIMVAGALASWWLLRRWRYGVVLRALGNNRAALENSGWSPVWTRLGAYALAGVLVDIAGLLTTSVTTSADINASATLTLITFAVVVVGGCRFQGGIVVPAGVVCAAVAFSLLASVLSFMNVTAAWNTAVEGLVLVAAVGAKWFIEGFSRYFRSRGA
jgi:ribose/xylose/arabinose/galactoside ABC-type transport system permease subunit